MRNLNPSKTAICLGLVVLTISIGPGVAGAQPNVWPLATTQRDDSPLAAFDPFTKDQWSIDFVGQYTHPFTNGPQTFTDVTVGVGKAVLDGLQVSGQFNLDYIDDASADDSFSVGFTLETRLRVLKIGRASIYLDGSVGVMGSDVDVPAGGTHFDFRETAGVGAFVPITERLMLLGGAHIEHSSNAGIGDDNPGYNGVVMYVGVSLPL